MIIYFTTTTTIFHTQWQIKSKKYHRVAVMQFDAPLPVFAQSIDQHCVTYLMV